MPELTIGSIVEFVGGEFHGDRNRIVRGVRPLSEATEDDLSFLSNPRYESAAHESAASAILVGRDLQGGPPSWIRVDDPYYAFALVLEEWFFDIPRRPAGVSPAAQVAPSAKLGQDVAIGPFVTIGESVEIGQGVTIHAGSSIGDDTRLGDDTLIYPNVSIYHGSRIGRRCIIHSGAVVGSDGFGFATFEGTHHKIPQTGIVRIEDDVEVGAGTTIDRATLGETVIGTGTKIDNLVQVAHNVKIGRHCFVAAQAGIAGSTEIGDNCSFGGQSGVTGHVSIASKVMVAAKSAVMKSVREAVTLAGSPARPLREQRKQEAMIRRLPKFIKRLEKLEHEAAKKNGER